MKWVIWRIWLGTPSKWLEWTLWESPYELRMSVPIKVTWNEWFDQTLSKWMESMRNEWIEVNRVKWVNWRIWLCEPYGKIPMVSRRCPYESDLRWVIWSNPIKMNGIDEKWMNRVNRGEMSEWMEMTWNNPMGMVLWSVEGVPIKVTGMNPMRMSLSKWMESMRNEWNEVNRGE